MSLLRRIALPLGMLFAFSVCAAGETARNVVLISIDTLRADHVGAYGYTRPTTPHLDRVAARGVRFAQAYAPSPWTKPSHAALFTGRYPGRNGAATMAGKLRRTVPHLAEVLSGEGFQTAAIVNASWLQMDGLERGFAPLEWIPFEQGNAAGSPVTPRALQWLERRDRTRPFLLLVHYMDVHSDYTALPRNRRRFTRPYDGPWDGTTQQLYRLAEGLAEATPRDLDHLRDLYDAGLRQVDGQVGALLKALEREGLLDDSLIVITSDHGEEFGEHGSAIHGHTQFEEVLRIPLIFAGPGIPAAVVETPVSLIDVMPTILAQLGGRRPLVDGIDLQPSWSGGQLAERLLFFEADVTFPPPAPGLVPPGRRRAVRFREHKLHFDTGDGSVALFDLANDPGETEDLAARRPALSAALRDALLAYLRPGSADEAPPPPSTDLRGLAGAPR